MISKDTIEFLKHLAANNDRDWFQANKTEFENAKTDLRDLSAYLIGEISKFDPQIAHVLPQDCVFRIYRDVRFSKDKSPYKTHLGAYISPGGRKSMAPGYYFHLQPGQSFLAGGKYHPDSSELLKLRNSIVNNTEDFLNIFADKAYKKAFGEMHGEKLVKPPKGFPADHKAIEYLKLKNFIAYREMFDDELLLSKEFPKLLVSYFKQMQPLIVFLRKALA